MKDKAALIKEEEIVHDEDETLHVENRQGNQTEMKEKTALIKEEETLQDDDETLNYEHLDAKTKADIKLLLKKHPQSRTLFIIYWRLRSQTEWRKEDDRRLYHMATCLSPYIDWDIVSGTFGRTPSECMERFEKLKDTYPSSYFLHLFLNEQPKKWF